VAEMFFTDALRAALDEAMASDPAVILMGEDLGVYGGAFGVTRGLREKYGPARVLDTPISENGFLGVAVGAAMTGLRPVVEIMFMDFLLLAADQLANHAAKLHYMYNRRVTVPLVVRTPSGAGRGYGASHSQNLESLFLGVPGLKIVVPSTPADAKGLLASAIRDPNPVLFVEPKALYNARGDVPEGPCVTPLGAARVVRKGDDLTLIAYGAGLEIARAAAAELAEGGIESDLLDLRSLKPLDEDTLVQSVRRTGRCVVCEEGPLTGGVGAEVSARVMEHCFSALKAPVMRVAAKDCPMPASLDLERRVMPSVEALLSAVERVF